MTRFRCRAALIVTVAAVLAMSAARAALAVEERAWLSLEAGADLYDPEQALRDAPSFGLRAAGFLNRWVGVEGLYHHASTSVDPTSLGDATVSHYGAGLIITPQRYAWALPYLYGGIGSIKVARDKFATTETQSAFHAGVGAVFRAGERIGFRLDARDVSYKQDGGPGRPTRVNEFQISSGVTAFWLGRPRDTDADGVPNKNDKCPETPHGSVVDAGGCPLDSDGDKVFDGLDKCAGTPGGAVVDANGCPLDTDQDGVFDGLDKCADTAKGILVDAQGCPMDTDGDGVFDGPDQCPGTPKGSVVDATGCPVDADLDGVPDGIDTCPFTPPGTPVNAGGCPIALSPMERDLMNDWIIRLSDLEFVPDSVKLTPQGLARVDSVGAMLAQWPMLKFEVGVHSDNLGEDARRQPLSHLRARYILQQIYAKHPNLNPKNYYYTGYGDTQPIASNKTAEGRALNRRAEFKLLSMDALTRERARRESLGTTAVPPAPGIGHRAPGEPGGPANERAPSPPQDSGSAPQGGAGAGVQGAGVQGAGVQGAGGAVPSGAAQEKPAAAAAPEEKQPTGAIPHAPTPPSAIPPAPSPPDSIPPPSPAPPDSVK